MYRVNFKGHGLSVGDLLFGGNPDFRKDGNGKQYRFRANDELGNDKGLIFLSSAWVIANVTLELDPLHYGVGEKDLIQLLQWKRQIRRPDIDTIKLFFEKNIVPPASIDSHSMNYEMYEKNKTVYFDEFKNRVLMLNPNVDVNNITTLWYMLVDCFKKKSPDLARQFITYAAEIGLNQLQEESPRLFWSGKKSKEHAFEKSRPPPEATALEMTDIGRLLDKLSVMQTVPWELSTILWGLVSRYFGMGATGDIHVYLDGGFAKGNVFWNDELPMLRLMQRYGAVREIILHIWHTEEQRWKKEFNIESDKFELVFHKGKRNPAPTLENPDATRSYRFSTPVQLGMLRRTLDRYLVGVDRKYRLLLYNFRKKTNIFARPKQEKYGLEIHLFEYGSEQNKILFLHGMPPYEKSIFAIEQFLTANFNLYAQLPEKIDYFHEAIFEGRKILAARGHDRLWYYRTSFFLYLHKKDCDRYLQQFLTKINAIIGSKNINMGNIKTATLTRELVDGFFNGVMFSIDDCREILKAVSNSNCNTGLIKRIGRA